MKHLLLIAALVAAGCCTTDAATPIFVETSLARLELPERPSRAVRLSAGAVENTWYVLSPDQATQAPSVERSQVSREEPERGTCNDNELEDGGFGRLDVCLANRVSLGASRRNDGPWLGHLRLYLAGRERERAEAGNFSLALSGAYGRDDERWGGDNAESYDTRVERRETHLGLILGYRLAKTLLVYGGPYSLRTDFDIAHRPPGTVTEHSSGHIAARGAHLGIGLFAGRFSSFLVEYSRARIEAGTGGDTLGNWSAVYQLDLGTAPAVAAPSTADEPRRPRSSRY